MFCILLPFLKQNWGELVHDKPAERRGSRIFHWGLALDVESGSGMGLGRLMLISLNLTSWSGELWVKAAGDISVLGTHWSPFTFPDSEYPWTATPITPSLPFPDPLASASGHVSACSPRPALPVLYRPPVNRRNSLFLSHSPLCNPWACIPYQQGSTSPSFLLFPNQPLRSSCTQQLAPRSFAV